MSSSKSLTATHSNTVTSPATSASMTSFYSETFSGGLSGWTASTGPGGVATGTAALWMHSTVGPTGTYAIDPVASTTAADGFLLYDSDVNCSGNQNARITSPVIDCSAHPTVKLVFQEYYRKFYDTTIVQISNDGTTWTDFVVHDGLSNNDFSGANPTIQNINISSVAGGQATVYIRFNFVSRGGGNNGCAYSWMIDDISLDEVPDNDLAIVESYDVITYMTPSNQAAAPIAFGSTLRNLGAATQSNTVLNASVLNSSSTSLFTGSANPIDLVSGIDSLAEITGTYTPSSTTGLYRTVYNVASDSVDADMTNNTDTTYFAVSDSSYSCVSGLDE